MTGQPASQRRANAHVEDVRQRGRVPARSNEVREKAFCEPDPPRRAELHEELNARADAGDGDRPGVIDVQGAEDEEPTAPAAPYLVRDDLSGLEARDRAEPSLADLARGAEKKLGPGPIVSCARAELHDGLHRPRSGEPLGKPRRIASTA